MLREGAERAVAAAGATCETVSVPGAFEIPAAIGFAAKAEGRFDGFVALGCVIRGETTHYDHICNETARALQDLMRCDGVAAGYGILTVENEAQALVRASPDTANGRARQGRRGGARLSRADRPEAPVRRQPLRQSTMSAPEHDGTRAASGRRGAAAQHGQARWPFRRSISSS